MGVGGSVDASLGERLCEGGGECERTTCLNVIEERNLGMLRLKSRPYRSVGPTERSIGLGLACLEVFLVCARPHSNTHPPKITSVFNV